MTQQAQWEYKAARDESKKIEAQEEYDRPSNEDMEHFKRGGRDRPPNRHVHLLFRGILNNMGRA